VKGVECLFAILGLSPSPAHLPMPQVTMHAATALGVTDDVLHQGKQLYFSDTDCRLLVNKFSQFFLDMVHRRQPAPS